MGVLPLQFLPGETRRVARPHRHARRSTSSGIAAGLAPGKRADRARAPPPTARESDVRRAVARIDTPDEVEYYRHGGILPYVLRQLARH